MFERLLANQHATPERLTQGLAQLFATMHGGGLYGVDDIPWFNGGLFQTIAVPRLNAPDLAELRRAAQLDWNGGLPAQAPTVDGASAAGPHPSPPPEGEGATAAQASGPVHAAAPPGTPPRMTPWPRADVVIGNPPFLGDKKMRAELGDAYTTTLRQTYAGRVPGGADLVCYWFDKARAQIEAGQLQRAGLVSTNSIRGGANRKVLDAIAQDGRIFEAWSDEPWINNGAAVRVSLVCFGDGAGTRLNGADVPQIYADLTAPSTAGDSLNLGLAQVLAANQGAHRLSSLRQAWLNPPGWTQTVPEVVPLGLDASPYPARTVARPACEKQLQERTLTRLYSQRPAWLAAAHAQLDAAVAAAYGWSDYSADLPDEEILRRLLALNRQRSDTGARA